MEQRSLFDGETPAPAGQMVPVRCKDCGAEWLKRKDGLEEWSGRCRDCSDRNKRTPLRECPQCHQMFWPEKQKQRHCSKSCGAKSYVRPTKPIEPRFWKRVQKAGEDECWNWTGQLGTAGYGTIFYRGRIQGAHRVSYQLFRGEIPDGLFVCHTCDNRACVNPAHLWIGTHADNMRDAGAKGRTAMQTHPERSAFCGSSVPRSRGERQHSAKLTADAVREIRRRAQEGTPKNQLAREFGVSFDSIAKVVSRRSWAHI